MNRLARTLCLIGITGAAAAGGGCALDTKPGSESIFTLVRGPSLEEGAAWAIDKFDAEKRYRGTLIIADQPFAGEELYLRVFLDNIKDEDARVRMASIRGLANHGRPEHAALIIPLLKDADPQVRKEAARGLQRLSSDDAVEPLIAASREPDLEAKEPTGEADDAVRVEAVDALGQFPSDKVLQSLVQSLADSRLVVNEAARSSLRTLTGQDFGLDRRAWLDWLRVTREPFKARALYTYNVFHRDIKWYERLPFVSKPPNETTSIPNGMPLPGVK